MQGANYRTISNQFAVGVSNVSKCIHDVSCQILLHMYHTYVRFPNVVEASQNMQAWRSQIGIPEIVGAIDDTHILIRRSCIDGEVYYDRKSNYSLSVQGRTHFLCIYTEFSCGRL